MDVVPKFFSRKVRAPWVALAALTLGCAVAVAQDYGQNDQDPPQEAVSSAPMLSNEPDDGCQCIGESDRLRLIGEVAERIGEAQLAGQCAVVSCHRLGQEFYGLPGAPKLFHKRLLKESVHELGHTLTLPHCDDYQCVMAPSHGVEWIDLKSHRFCGGCRSSVPSRAAITTGRP